MGDLIQEGPFQNILEIRFPEGEPTPHPDNVVGRVTQLVNVPLPPVGGNTVIPAPRSVVIQTVENIRYVNAVDLPVLKGVTSGAIADFSTTPKDFNKLGTEGGTFDGVVLESNPTQGVGLHRNLYLNTFLYQDRFHRWLNSGTGSAVGGVIHGLPFVNTFTMNATLESTAGLSLLDFSGRSQPLIDIGGGKFSIGFASTPGEPRVWGLRFKAGTSALALGITPTLFRYGTTGDILRTEIILAADQDFPLVVEATESSGVYRGKTLFVFDEATGISSQEEIWYLGYDLGVFPVNPWLQTPGSNVSYYSPAVTPVAVPEFVLNEDVIMLQGEIV